MGWWFLLAWLDAGVPTSITMYTSDEQRCLTVAQEHLARGQDVAVTEVQLRDRQHRRGRRQCDRIDVDARLLGALVALFEIGADTTSLKVLRDDEMLYDRDQAFGGSQLTQLISRQYGFSFQEAEAKKLSGDLPEDYDSAILAPFVDSLSQEIGRALQYFFTSTPHHKVHYVMLAGGTATLPGLKDRVTDLTGFASNVVNPFDQMQLGSAVRESRVRREAPSYLTACGLAMRRFVQ
jgi:type IV pilus assembly protein PilM